MSEAASSAVEALKSTASSISKLSQPTTPSDVGQVAMKGEVARAHATRKDWKEVCAKLEEKNAKLTKLRSERDNLKDENRGTSIRVQRNDMFKYLPFSYRTTTVQKRLTELKNEIGNLEDRIRGLEQDKITLQAKLDELDATMAATALESVRQGVVNPEYSDMRDFDGILNET